MPSRATANRMLREMRTGKKELPPVPTTTKPARPPRRHSRTKTATVLVRELLLLNVDIDTIATKVGLPTDALRRLYRHEIDEFRVAQAGRPAHIPTEHSLKQAKYCGSIGLSDADIRRILVVPESVYQASYKEHVEDGRAQGRLVAHREMFRKATKESDKMPNVTANIFWMKAKAGWRETDSLEISGPDGGPIQTQHAVVILPPKAPVIDG